MRTRWILACAALASCGRFGFDESCGVEPLALSPDTARANLDSDLPFTATGGCPPYAFAQTGTGTIDPAGVYTTGSQAGTAEITVTDAVGDTARATLEIGGTSLWFIGGAVNDVPQTDVWRSDDGRSWTMVGNLPAATRAAVTLVYDDRIWVIGGTAANPTDAVWVSSDGSTWELAGRLPAPNSYPTATVFQREIWMIGGNGVPGEVYRSADGAGWTRLGKVPIASHGATAVAFGGQLIYVGGHDVDNVFYDEVRATTDGAAWTTIGRLPSTRELMGTWLANGALVVAGGLDVTAELDEVVTSTDGSTWSLTGTLPAKRNLGAWAELAGRRWSVGGLDGGAVWSSPDGVLWTVETTNFPLPRADGGLVVFTPR